MPWITKLLDQKTGEFHVLLLQRLLPKETLLSDGENAARYRVTRDPDYVATVGRDFALEGQNLPEVMHE